jgi:hypothetical protein
VSFFFVSFHTTFSLFPTASRWRDIVFLGRLLIAIFIFGSQLFSSPDTPSQAQYFYFALGLTSGNMPTSSE